MLAGLGAAIALSVYLQRHREEIALLPVPVRGPLALAILSYLVSLIAFHWVRHVMLGAQVARPPFADYIAVCTISTAFNLVAPLGSGNAYAMRQLRLRFSVGYVSYVSSLVASNLIFVFECLVAATAALWWLGRSRNDPRYEALGIFTAGSSVILSFVLLWIRSRARESTVVREEMGGQTTGVVDVLEKSVQMLLNPRVPVGLVFAVTAGRLLAMVISLRAVYASIDIHLGPIESVFLRMMTNLTALISITPQSLGVTEVTSAVVADAIAVDPSHSIVATLIARICTIGVLLVLAPAAWAYIAIRGGQKEPKGDDTKSARVARGFNAP